MIINSSGGGIGAVDEYIVSGGICGGDIHDGKCFTYTSYTLKCCNLWRFF